MKGKVWYWIAGGAALLVFVLIIFVQMGKPIFSSATVLTEQEARTIAEERYSGTVKKIQQTADEYVIQIERDTGIYELKIRAESGEVSSLKHVKTANEGNQVKPPLLKEEEIKTLVFQQVNGEIKSMSQHSEGEKIIYRVIVNENNAKTTMTIDAETGDILTRETVEIEQPQSKLTEAEASAMALAQVPGVVDDVEVETINGMTYYIVEVESSNEREAKIEINAITGEVKSLTWDDREDDHGDDD